MGHVKIFIFLSVTILVLICFPIQASSRGLEDPLFWIDKIQNPNRLLLTPSEIETMNEINLKRHELQLVSIREMKEEWSREEIHSFLIEDWKSFGSSRRPQFGKDGTPLKDSFWSSINENIYHDGLKEKNQLLFGMTVKRTDIRVFPADEISMSAPASTGIDLFQHSAIAPASPVGIYHLSRDRQWAYAQTSFIRGWIRTKDLAIAQDKNRVFPQADLKEPLVVTGNFVTVFADPLFQKPIFNAQMGSTFRVPHLPAPSPQVGEGRGEEGHQFKTIEKPSKKSNSYVINVPCRGADGQLILGNGYIPAKEDVHMGFLPYTQHNLARQAFKMLHEPYSWGEKNGGRDCSRFIMDIFNAFGILMPRNSNLQVKMGISLGPLEGKTLEEKKKILDKAVPLATLLRMPGHIMLYLGKHEGKHYAIHSILGIHTGGKSESNYQKIGKVVVTDLDLGKDGPKGSLLNRLTEIQYIGLDSDVRKSLGEGQSILKRS